MYMLRTNEKYKLHKKHHDQKVLDKKFEYEICIILKISWRNLLNPKSFHIKMTGR